MDTSIVKRGHGAGRSGGQQNRAVIVMTILRVCLIASSGRTVGERADIPSRWRSTKQLEQMGQGALLIAVLRPRERQTVQHSLRINLLQPNSMFFGNIPEAQKFAEETVDVVTVVNSGSLMNDLLNQFLKKNKKKE